LSELIQFKRRVRLHWLGHR